MVKIIGDGEASGNRSYCDRGSGAGEQAGSQHPCLYEQRGAESTPTAGVGRDMRLLFGVALMVFLFKPKLV